jgi:hypothetical protein
MWRSRAGADTDGVHADDDPSYELGPPPLPSLLRVAQVAGAYIDEFNGCRVLVVRIVPPSGRAFEITVTLN